MAMKPRVLYLIQYLEQKSGEQHPVTTAEIRKGLASKECPVSIINLLSDIKSLLEGGYYTLISDTCLERLLMYINNIETKLILFWIDLHENHVRENSSFIRSI